MLFVLTLILGALLFVLYAPFSPFTGHWRRFQARLFGARLALMAAICLQLLTPRLALAATVGAAAQSVDLTALWSWILSFALAVLAFYGRRALIAIEGRLNIQSGSVAADDLDQALVHGEACLLNGLKALASATSTVTISAGPLANAVALVQKLAPAAQIALGVTPADIENILLARIGVKVPQAAVVSEPTPASAPTGPAAPAAPAV